MVVLAIITLTQFVFEQVSCYRDNDSGLRRIFCGGCTYDFVLCVVSETVIGVQCEPFIEFECSVHRGCQPFEFIFRKSLAIGSHDVYAIGGLLRDNRGTEHMGTIGVIGHKEWHGMERVVRDVVTVVQPGRFVAGVIQVAGNRQIEPVFYVAADAGTDIGGLESVGVLFLYTVFGMVVGANEIVQLLCSTGNAQIVVPSGS